MLRCWQLDPLTRPTFAEIAKALQERVAAAETSTMPRVQDELYANVPNTQGYVERASMAAATFMPAPSQKQPDSPEYLVAVGGAKGGARVGTEASAEDYLTPSEHYFNGGAAGDAMGGGKESGPFGRDAIRSEYLTTSPRHSDIAEKERLLSSGSNNEPVEHGDDFC